MSSIQAPFTLYIYLILHSITLDTSTTSRSRRTWLWAEETFLPSAMNSRRRGAVYSGKRMVMPPEPIKRRTQFGRKIKGSPRPTNYTDKLWTFGLSELRSIWSGNPFLFTHSADLPLDSLQTRRMGTNIIRLPPALLLQHTRWSKPTFAGTQILFKGDWMTMVYPRWEPWVRMQSNSLVDLNNSQEPKSSQTIEKK